MPQRKGDRAKYLAAAARSAKKAGIKWDPPIDPETQMSGPEKDIRSYLEQRSEATSGPFGLPFDEMTGAVEAYRRPDGSAYGVTGHYVEAENSIKLNADRFERPWDDSSSTYAHEVGHFFDTQASQEDYLNDEGFWGKGSVLPKLDKEERANSFGHTLRELVAGKKIVNGFEEYQTAIDLILEKLSELGSEQRAASRTPNGR